MRKNDRNCRICKGQTKIWKSPTLGYGTFGLGSLAKFCRVIYIKTTIEPCNFKIYVLEISYFTEQSAKCRKMLFCKI